MKNFTRTLGLAVMLCTHHTSDASNLNNSVNVKSKDEEVVTHNNHHIENIDSDEAKADDDISFQLESLKKNVEQDISSLTKTLETYGYISDKTIPKEVTARTCSIKACIKAAQWILQKNAQHSKLEEINHIIDSAKIFLENIKICDDMIGMEMRFIIKDSEVPLEIMEKICEWVLSGDLDDPNDLDNLCKDLCAMGLNPLKLAESIIYKKDEFVKELNFFKTETNPVTVAERLIASFNKKIKFLKEDETSYPIFMDVANYIIETIEQTLELIKNVANKTINIAGYDDEQILKSLNIFYNNTISFLKSNAISSNFGELFLLGRYMQDYCLEIINAQKNTDVAPLARSIVTNGTKIIFSIFDNLLEITKKSDETTEPKLKKYEKEMDKLLEKVENYSDAMGIATNVLNKAEEELKKAKEELNKAKKELNKAKKELNKAEEELNKATADYNTIVKDYSACTETIKAKEELVNDLNNKATAAQSVYQNIIKYYSACTETIKAKEELVNELNNKATAAQGAYYNIVKDWSDCTKTISECDKKAGDTVRNIYKYTEKINEYESNLEEASNKRLQNLVLTNISAMHYLNDKLFSCKCIEQGLLYFEPTLSTEELKNTN